MSRVGKLCIKVPDKVSVFFDNGKVFVKGPKGELVKDLPKFLTLRHDSNSVSIVPVHPDNCDASLHGTYRSLVFNMVTGVTLGFQKKLDLQGVGYRSYVDKNALVLHVGFSHQVKVLVPEGVTLFVENNTLVTVGGIDKEIVGQVAANIRSVRPPEPYKGKGIRYAGEYVRKKLGKAGKK